MADHSGATAYQMVAINGIKIRRKAKQAADRLKELNLFSLETRRLRGQLIEVFKILRGFDNVDYSRWNALPSDVVNSDSVEQFKTRLDESGRGKGNFYKCKPSGSPFLENPRGSHEYVGLLF
ncbi:hypothetical protein O3P69_007445 [Scylla paramamosain]|uniref:Uncharacterized protein n=1 Tax=Scylla paramamosain TaxID=85552 RepID=A0AAW0V799_SCYPA